MAQRRMFSLKVVDTDVFLEMPPTSQLLYFHLAMRADDDGFVGNPKKIQRMLGSGEDDFKVLMAKRFLIPFESGVCVIKHWRMHNYIQTDRYSPTAYAEEKERLLLKDNGSYTEKDKCIQDVSKMYTQDRLGKDRIELGKGISEQGSQDIPQIIKLFEEVNPSCSKFYGNKTQRGAVDRLLKSLGREKLEQIIRILPKTNKMEFITTITTPLQLEDNYAKLEAQLIKFKLKGITNKTITI